MPIFQMFLLVRKMACLQCRECVQGSLVSSSCFSAVVQIHKAVFLFLVKATCQASSQSNVRVKPKHSAHHRSYNVAQYCSSATRVSYALNCASIRCVVITPSRHAAAASCLHCHQRDPEEVNEAVKTKHVEPRRLEFLRCLFFSSLRLNSAVFSVHCHLFSDSRISSAGVHQPTAHRKLVERVASGVTWASYDLQETKDASRHAQDLEVPPHVHRCMLYV